MQPLDIEQKLTSSKLADDLRQRIIQGELAPESRLRQREIAQYYDVSGMSARDAVKILLKEGFATQEGAKTVVVSPLSPMDFLEIMELRLMLEPRALELSGPRLSKKDFKELRAILGIENPDWSPLETAERHWTFHELLYSRAARPRSAAILQTLNGHLVRYMLPLWTSVGLGDDWRPHHLRLVDQVEAGAYKEASEELKADLLQTKSRVLENLVIDPVQ
ncbi:GntR family transcriptional regulator [Marinovum sp. 2_MG-2023]|uniref:GntR family transcriptional regulator n=1 Tax=unclassified Marinovum TaxID=2647166 RepID=UPI0026E40DF0|nr:MULTISPECIES: GntR family transcriptional regulator [unclassified Marinovum]MDO6729600.1 GntR family transcriptional regulator [Marinovum sp. 2_MG-2023]MDO6780246.1 GntR family transcriptional regulator [Marinovum sp. 1_MG-2023]